MVTLGTAGIRTHGGGIITIIGVHTRGGILTLGAGILMRGASQLLVGLLAGIGEKMPALPRPSWQKHIADLTPPGRFSGAPDSLSCSTNKLGFTLRVTLPPRS
jgi:hypothetical protein